MNLKMGRETEEKFGTVGAIASTFVTGFLPDIGRTTAGSRNIHFTGVTLIQK
ncbi:hypothetical protein [Paenibacillus sp. 276b]|uniref:hypothetical protein n=1 Tax=Paenibacillus sp. 276b TaxID=1566277 RepID=UPI001C40ACFF|nr:hypothetical protein [Paenibacillus sp. 276b]